MAPRVKDLDPLGEAVRSARDALGWSQEVLANRLGWSQGQVSDMERGRTERVNTEQLADLHRVLGLPIGEMAELGAQRLATGEVTP